MAFQFQGYGNLAANYPANAATLRSTKVRHDPPFPALSHLSLDGTEVLIDLPNRLALANNLHHEYLQVDESNSLDFGLRHTPHSGELSPEEHLFAGSNAFYADNYPLTQPIMPPDYNAESYANPSPSISPPSGLIIPHNGPSHHSYYPYSESGDALYSASPASQSDDSHAKRARNTAASARFRAKKKEREQELERSTVKIKSTVAKLEAKVVQLETENRWLKDLVTGKIKNPPEEKSEEKERNDKGVVDEWESHRHTDGVGTRRSGRLN